MEALWSLGHIESFSICDSLEILELESTHVVAGGKGGSVKLPFSSKDGVAAAPACGKDPMFREGAVATRKGNNPVNTRISQTSRIDIAFWMSCKHNG